MGCAASSPGVVHVNHNKKSPSSNSSSSSGSSKKKAKKKTVTIVEETRLTQPSQVATEIVINLATLQRYISLEKQVAQLEADNVVSTNDACKKEYDVCCRQIDQLNSSPPSPGDDYDTALENHNRMLTSLQSQKMHLEEQIKKTAMEVSQLQASVDEREDMLQQLFGGTYGSSLEDELESEYNRASQRLGHVKAFAGHWDAAIVYCKKSYEQMSTGYQYWVKASPNNYPDQVQALSQGVVVPAQLQLVADARSWLLASTTNLTTAVRILLDTLKVQIPYCHPPELDTLNKAIHHIFIDSRTADRHHHAGKVYYSMGTRSGGLNKWLEAVHTKNIQSDLAEAEQYAKQCQNALRMERLRLIRLQVQDKIGADALAEFDRAVSEQETAATASQTSTTNSKPAIGDVFTAAAAMNTAKKLKRNATVHVTNVDSNAAEEIKSEEPQFEAIPLEQLAAQPTRAQLYGEMFAIIEENKESRNKLVEINNEEKQKQKSALQAKLSARRRRKVD